MTETDDLLKQILEELKLLREDFNSAFFESEDDEDYEEDEKEDK